MDEERDDAGSSTPCRHCGGKCYLRFDSEMVYTECTGCDVTQSWPMDHCRADALWRWDAYHESE
ncbi:MAG: hypothetical protein B7733_05775 [Myxococcales bacterium FL481]|nr:MAG: hypothetical protein B7733_05775 [Myxococcales bacterium FL481]